MLSLCCLWSCFTTLQEWRMKNLSRRKPWIRKSPGSSIRTSALDDDTRGLTYKQRHSYHDMPSSAGGSSASSASSDTGSADLHPTDTGNLEKILNGTGAGAGEVLMPQRRMISAWDQHHRSATAWDAANPAMLAAPAAILSPVTLDLGLSPKVSFSCLVLSSSTALRQIRSCEPDSLFVFILTHQKHTCGNYWRATLVFVIRELFSVRGTIHEARGHSGNRSGSNGKTKSSRER